MSEDRVVVVGAGIGGLASAVALSRAGIAVRVLERDSELHEVGAVLGVGSNAMRALRQLGLAEEVASISAEVRTFEHRSSSGRVIARWPTGKVADQLGEPIMAASRPALLGAIAAAVPDGVVRLGAECTDVESSPREASARLADGEQESGALLIGADGGTSTVRARTGGEPLRYAGYTEWRGIVSLAGMTPAVQLQIYGPGLVFGLVPLAGDHVGWFGRWATPAGGRDEPGAAKDNLLALFGDWAEPVPQVIAACHDGQIARADIHDLPGRRRWGEGRISLLGDAAHATQPTLGLGAALALEDAAVLARCVSTHGPHPQALRDYESRRVARTARVVATSAQQAAINRWRRPAACRLREIMLSTLPIPLALRQYRKTVRFDD
jgi:2-polyprenyl-6-methoxyphenol hydroxylase-like FAD-dependent oxidoreductase